MFGRRKKEWNLDLNVEGELQAMAVSRKEGYKAVDPTFDRYPINIQLPKKFSLKEAVQKAIDYGQAGIYSIVYKCKKKPS